VVINIEKFRKKRVTRLMRLEQVAKLRGLAREEDLLCVNWNPAFGSIAMSCYQTPQELSPDLPDENADLQPAFVIRVHALASQI
jgi:hypothetical protein